VTKLVEANTPLIEVLAIPGAEQVFRKYGIACMGWAGVRFETIEQGARAHGVPVEKILNDLRQLENKN